MRKAFFVVFLLLVIGVIFVKEMKLFSKDVFLLTHRSNQIENGSSQPLPYSSGNAQVEIFDKTQLLFMNIP